MILDFSDIKKEDLLVAGGKGANLGEMISVGINVPNGFVITSDSYKYFLKENGITELMIQELNRAKNDEYRLKTISKSLRELITKGSFPTKLKEEILKKYFSLGNNVRVAVRSSATAEDLPEASFAGQQETYLNVVGVEEVLNKIKNCYASLWSDRVIKYRINNGYDQTSVAIAVVIQEMIESEKSGVLFTVNPLTQNKDEIQINASYGLGESIVSGKVTADSYIVGKNGEIKSITIGSKEVQIVYDDINTKIEIVKDEKRKEQALNNDEIISLTEAGLEIEKHYHMPMDIEWSIKDDEIYILQARAITTLKNNDLEKIVDRYTKNIKVKNTIKESIIFLLEKAPFIFSPLEYDFMIAISEQKEIIFKEGGIIYDINPKMDDDGIMVIPNGSRKVNKNIFKIFKIIRDIKDYDKCYYTCKQFMDEYKRKIEQIRNLSYKDMTLLECKSFILNSYDLLRSIAYDRFKFAIFPSVAREKFFTKIVKKVDKKYSAFDLYWGLNNKTSVVTNDIFKLSDAIKENDHLTSAILSGESFENLYNQFSDFKSLIDDFLSKNGFKLDYNCYLLEGKSFIENPNRILSILKPVLKDKDSTKTMTIEDYHLLMDKLKTVYPQKFDSIEKDINHLRYFHFVREETQYMWEELFYNIKNCVKRINLILFGDENYKSGVGNLFLRELIDVMERGFLNESDKEKIERRIQKSQIAVKVWNKSKNLIFDSTGDILKGVVGSPGGTVGKVCIVNGPEDFFKMEKGDILVCHLTDPEWTPLFKLASAVVADTGSALSHAAIVAREFNIPAVLGVGFATNRFKDGDMIMVDGYKGEVKLC